MQPTSSIQAVWGALVQPKIPCLGTWLHAAARILPRSRTVYKQHRIYEMTVLLVAMPFRSKRMSTSPPKLLDDAHEILRARHDAYRTEQSSIDWMRRSILFHQKRHPREMGRPESEAFLIHLATEQRVAASTQNQARSAILFLYRSVLEIPVDVPVSVLTARTPRHLPAVFRRAEVQAVLAHMHGPHLRMAQVRYGSGMRLLACSHVSVCGSRILMSHVAN